MKQIVFGKSVQGASHKRTGKECQDNRKALVCSDNQTIIMAVADGHGSDSCPYSSSGSAVAVEVFCKIMRDLCDSYRNAPEMLMTYLNREGDTKVAGLIDEEWKLGVRKVHAKNKRSIPRNQAGQKVPNDIYLLYGSTLLGVMITPTYLFAFQLGDGDIVYVNSQGFDTLLESDKILGTETHSLAKPNSWKKAVTAVKRWEVKDHLPSMVMLSTDGFANSHVNEEEFRKTCLDYFDMLHVHGPEAVAENLASWLSETSAVGCGDDITVQIFYSFDEEANAQAK